MRKGILQSLKFIAFLAVGIVLLWLAFRNVDFSKLAADLKEADYSWLLLSILFGLFAFISRARRWILLINPLGFNPSLRNSFYAMMTGYLANIALPRIGEITRCVALGKKEKIPVDQLFGTVVVERTIDFLSLLLIMIILILTSGDQIGLFLKESILIPIQQKVFSIFGVTWVLWVILFSLGIITLYLMIRYKKSLRKIRFFSKMFDLARGIINGLKTITNLKRKWEFIFHTIFIWINYTLMTWVVVFSLESTSHLAFGDSFFLLVIGGLAMSAPVQSGLGAFHYIISRGLLIVKGIPIEDGLVYALLAHESQLIFVAIIGTISFFIIFRKDKTQITSESTS
ncbi:MAG: lysylphosphatidylglycerol synthase transmembrane domain-containing protein [Bacteroidia bacterium]|nr:lysylphosphatidylglycerol synthase transmembrane domain-containing protein [Bacteroidia bacterium]